MICSKCSSKQTNVGQTILMRIKTFESDVSLFICGAEFIFHLKIPARHDNLRVTRYTSYWFVRHYLSDFSSFRFAFISVVFSCGVCSNIKATRNAPNSNDSNTYKTFVCLFWSFLWIITAKHIWMNICLLCNPLYVQPTMFRLKSVRNEWTWWQL